MNFSMINY